MAIETIDSRFQYIAGTSASHSIPFVFESADDIEVYNGSTKLTDSQYTIVGEGIDPAPGTRTITLDPAPTVGDVITLMRNAKIQRTTDFTVAGNFNAVNVNKEVDRLILFMQQINTKLAELGLQYPDYVDDSSGISINRIGKLPPNDGSGIPVWTTNTAGDLINGKIVEDSGCSTLRSELANDQENTNGAELIGYYNPATSTSTTVKDNLDTLNNTVISSFFTGMAIDFYGTAADVQAGWIFNDGGTIGNASSGATTLHDSTAQNLFLQLWGYTNSDGQWLPIFDSVGAPTTRGANAQADWDANKRLSLPQSQGKTKANITQMTITATFTVASSVLTLENVPTVASSFPHGSAVTVTSTGTYPSGLAAATTYYVIYVSPTTVKLAANQDDVVKDTPTHKTIGTTYTGTLSLVRTLASHSPCQWKGEDEHLTTISELPAHEHNIGYGITTYQVGDSTATPHLEQGGSYNINTAGGSNAASIVQPTIYCGEIIKL